MSILLGTESATLRRYSASTRDADTGYTIPGSYTETAITGSFQAAGGKDREALPEGVRSSQTIVLYTNADVRTADARTGLDADRIEYNGQLWTVVMVDRWPKLLSHHKATLLLDQES